MPENIIKISLRIVDHIVAISVLIPVQLKPEYSGIPNVPYVIKHTCLFAVKNFNNPWQLWVEEW